MKNPLKIIYHNYERYQARKNLAKHPDVTVIGVTGSFGKTNTTQAINQMLSLKYKTLMTDLNLDTIYNVPKTVLKLKDQQKLIVELGVDHMGEMLTHLEIVKPTIGVLTGIAPVHADLEHLGSLEGIVAEKSHLLEVLPPTGWAIMNFDDTNVRNMVNKTSAQVIRYGLKKEHCNIWADQIEVAFTGTKFQLNLQKIDLPVIGNKVTIKTPLIGRHHVYTIMAAAAVGLTQGLTLPEIAQGAAKLEPLEGRVSIEKGPLGTTLINDSRRANLASTLAGLDVLVDLPGKRKIAILGPMAEMGKYEEAGHREVGQKVASVKPNLTLCVGEPTKFIVAEALKTLSQDQVIWCADVFSAADRLKPLLEEGDLVYLKGSLLRHMERILLLLEGKAVVSDKEALHHYQVYR